MSKGFYRSMFFMYYKSPDDLAEQECRAVLGQLDVRMKGAFQQGLVSTSKRFYHPNAPEKAISCAMARMISSGDMIVTQKDFHDEEDSGIDVTMTYKGPVTK